MRTRSAARSRRPGCPRAGRPALPGYPYDRNRPIVAEGSVPDVVRPASDPSRRDRRPGRRTHRAAAGQRGARALAGTAASTGASEAWCRCRPAGRREDGRHRLQLVGGRGRPHDHRQAAARQRPAPVGAGHAVASGTRWGCTAGLACPFDVAGFTFSGVPGVVIGHNDRIAWGFTNLGPDVTDLYLEQVDGDRYLYKGELDAAGRPGTRRSGSPAASRSTITVREHPPRPAAVRRAWRT